MTWEETVIFIRQSPEYSDLVGQAYLDEDLELNVRRFLNSEEFQETLNLMNEFAPHANKIADIGCGNGFTAVAFALNNYSVTAIEPCKSETVGYEAIKFLKKIYNLPQLTVLSDYGEKLSLPDESVDAVYMRQAMHHANHLNKFISEASRILKKGGLFFSVRDHIVYNNKDKLWFLKTHPLQKYYEGENAFTLNQYSAAIQNAGLSIVKILKHFDSVINYFPLTIKQFNELSDTYLKTLKNSFTKYTRMRKFEGVLFNFFKICFEKKNEKSYNETNIPGRLYSFIAIKNRE